MDADTLDREIRLTLDSYVALTRGLPDEAARESFLWSYPWQLLSRRLFQLGSARLAAEAAPLPTVVEQVAEYGHGLTGDPVLLTWSPAHDALAVTSRNAPVIRLFRYGAPLPDLMGDTYRNAAVWAEENGLWIAGDGGRRVTFLNAARETETRLDIERAFPDRATAAHLIHFARFGERLYFILQNAQGNQRRVCSVPLGDVDGSLQEHPTDVSLWPRQFNVVDGALLLTDHWFPVVEALDGEGGGFRLRTFTFAAEDNRGCCAVDDGLLLASPRRLLQFSPAGKLLAAGLVGGEDRRPNLRNITATPSRSGTVAALDMREVCIREFALRNNPA